MQPVQKSPGTNGIFVRLENYLSHPETEIKLFNFNIFIIYPKYLKPTLLREAVKNKTSKNRDKIYILALIFSLTLFPP